jgi:tRNA dimethylallyltransferase
MPGPLIAICGPTASGKSALAHHVARIHDAVELVSVDAFGVYVGMDIGTASPSPEQRAEVRYHLVDVVRPDETFSVTEFQAAYRKVRQDLQDRQVTGILVGGTGLYHRMVIDDLTPPGQWPEIASVLRAEAEQKGPEHLHAQLAQLDPLAASRMKPTNTRRVVRALEVCRGSGRPFSSFGPGLEAYPENPIHQIGLRWPMETLTQRIRDRVHAMVTSGWVEEVERILAAGGFSRTAAQAVGYREMVEVCEARMSIEEASEQIVLRTRQLAVRQLRWFRRDPRIRWVDVESDPVSEVADEIARLVGS